MDYQRMSIYKLRDRARASHPEHTPEAPRAFVMRALDMEVERRTVHLHENVGWYTCSPEAPGGNVGGTDIAREPLAHIADRWAGAHDAHEYVASWLRLARLSEHQLLAALIQAAKTDRRVPGPWAATYDQIAANLGHYAQLLGWAPGQSLGPILRRDKDGNIIRVPRDPEKEGSPKVPVWDVPAFASGKAITEAARRARTELILLAQV